MFPREMSRPRAAPRNRRARISRCRRTRCQAQPRRLHQVYPPHASTSFRCSRRLRSSAGEPIVASAPRLLQNCFAGRSIPERSPSAWRGNVISSSPAVFFLPTSVPGNSNHVHPSAHHLWLANDTATLLRVETAKEPERVHRHGLTPAFSTRQESSALIRRFWGTPSPWTREY